MHICIHSPSEEYDEMIKKSPYLIRRKKRLSQIEQDLSFTHWDLTFSHWDGSVERFPAGAVLLIALPVRDRSFKPYSPDPLLVEQLKKLRDSEGGSNIVIGVWRDPERNGWRVGDRKISAKRAAVVNGVNAQVLKGFCAVRETLDETLAAIIVTATELGRTNASHAAYWDIFTPSVRKMCEMAELGS